MIRLIGIDVDGTLVGSSGIVAPAVWEAAARARAAGIRLALCSGRPAFGTALQYARELDASGWHVFQNGASVLHLASARSLSVSLPVEAVNAIIEQAHRTGHLLELYSDSDYVTPSTSPWAHMHAQLLGLAFAPRPFESLCGPCIRAQWLIKHQEAAAVLCEVPAHLEVAQSSSPLMPQTRFIGLTQEGVSKGSALRTIAADYGIPLEQVMYVGDAENDLSALRIVGHPVAMQNADQAVIEAATLTVGHVEAGGLAEALEFAIKETQLE